MEQYRLFNVAEVAKMHRQISDLLSVIGKSRGKPKEDAAWLIEWPAAEGGSPSWWHPGRGWVKDANFAARFSRQEDAQAFIDNGRFVGGVVATEHMWIGFPVSATAA